MEDKFSIFYYINNLKNATQYSFNERKIMFKKITALVATLTLTFVGLTTGVTPTQPAQADAQSDYYDSIATRWNSSRPVLVNFCGYKWDVVGINDGAGNNAGLGADSNLPIGAVSLLLDKSNTISGLPEGKFDAKELSNAYKDSTLSELMDNTVYNGLTCDGLTKNDIIARDLNELPVPVIGQRLWAISFDEATALTANRFWYSTPISWWTRTEGRNGQHSSRVTIDGLVRNNALINEMLGIRPALYLSLSSNVFSDFKDLATQYTVKYNLGSGSGALDDQTFTQGYAKTLSNYGGEKYGYTFEGWDTNSSATTVTYGQDATVSNLSTTNGAVVNLYAVWKAKVNSISVDPTNTTVTVGQTANLNATITAEPTFENIIWSSSNNSLATVNSTGTVTTSNVGDVTITAKSVTDETKYATTTVHIVPLVIPVNSVSVTPSAVTLTAGQAKQLSVTVLPVYADNKQFNCSSSNSVIASATRQSTNVCKITTKTAGTVTIKATAVDGSGVFGTSVITVKPKPVSTKAKKAKGSITFIWGASGLLTTVEIYYRVKGSSKWKIVRVSGADRKKIKLKRKKTYQFQLRSCKTVKGKNYYSTWTKKTIKL
jgi:uncharacterized protein YjdB